MLMMTGQIRAADGLPARSGGPNFRSTTLIWYDYFARSNIETVGKLKQRYPPASRRGPSV